MTPKIKKWAALGAVVLVLGVGAGIFMQQTTARVEAEVRAALAGLPGLAEHSVDKVQFNILSQTLTLTNMRLLFKEKDNTTEVTLGEVVAVKPNPKALEGGDGGALLAEEVRVSQYVASATTTKPPAQAQSRADSMRFVKPQADIPGLMNLAMVDGKPKDAAKGLKALDSIKAASLNYAGLSVDVTSPELPTMRMTLDSMDAHDLTVAYTGSATLKNWVIDVKGMGNVSLGGMEMTALTVPDLSKFPPALLTQKAAEADPDAVLAAFKTLMPTDKPMLGKLVLQDVKESFSGGNMSLQRLAVDNFWYFPMQGGLTLEGLSVPARLMPSPIISMLGYERVNMSGDVSLRPLPDKKDKLIRLAANLNMQDAGKVQLSMEMEDPVAAGAATLSDIDNLLLGALKLSYTDAGLAGRGVRLAQGAMNMGPEMITGLARASAKDIVGNNPENIKLFMNFVEKPGELTINITPTKPTRVGKADELLNSDALRVTSVPGPKTLQELAKP